MLRIAHIEEIADLLLLLPDMVRQQERRSPDFVSNVGTWLISLERVFVAGRLYHAGRIATLRSALVAVAQGQVPAGIAFKGRQSHSRVLNSVASEALQRAGEVASTLIGENQPRLSEAERVAQQIVAAALSRELIPPRENDVNNTEYLRILRRIFATNVDLEKAVVHLEGLVGPNDALILFDRALSVWSVTFPSSGKDIINK